MSLSVRRWTSNGATSVQITSALAVLRYDRIRRAVVAHVFGERTMATLERLLSLLSVFDVVYG
ncbi:IS1 family transposase [Klebsiella pneumoniae]|uniref:IS1 family transposase n=1 Tax=Klebsiella pneumoniae TaxID=573 RepID=UPI003A5CB769